MIWLTDRNLELFTAKSQSSNSRDDNVIQKREAYIYIYNIYIPLSLTVAPQTHHNTTFMGIQLSPSVCNTIHWNSQVGLYVMHASANTSAKAQYLYGFMKKWKTAYIWKIVFSFEGHSTSAVITKWLAAVNQPLSFHAIVTPNANRSNRFVSEWKKAVCFCFTCRIVSYLCLNNIMVNGAITSMWLSEAMKRHRSKWTLTQLIEALSHQLNQWWLINNRVLWHWPYDI